jgi:SPP1 family predicted phage head-tail adaptor
MTTAGEMRERVSFQQRGLDANGDRLGAWGGDVTVWAQVRPMKGGEPVIQARLQGVQPVEITIRSSSATRPITSAWRAMWNGRPHNIRTVTPDERREFIAMVAEADQSDA